MIESIKKIVDDPNLAFINQPVGGRLFKAMNYKTYKKVVKKLQELR